MTVSSDKFESAVGSYRSRLYSPVVHMNPNLKFCLRFMYNIYGSGNDGFNLRIENYLNVSENEVLLFRSGPGKSDRWHEAHVTIQNVRYSQLRVGFSLFYGSINHEFEIPKKWCFLFDFEDVFWASERKIERFCLGINRCNQSWKRSVSGRFLLICDTSLNLLFIENQRTSSILNRFGWNCESRGPWRVHDFNHWNSEDHNDLNRNNWRFNGSKFNKTSRFDERSSNDSIWNKPGCFKLRLDN